MAARKSKRERGISRIDQKEKRTHGFFVRLTRKGKIYNAFFSDKVLGGKKKALEAARNHYQELLRKHGPISRKKITKAGRTKASGATAKGAATKRTRR
ncbi:MAG TPA: hypothetical protein VFM25_07590 [Verrucomicrobiae bacterium]|nr:hypothetical protein [Verrucomicrobiae bacterium]